MLMPLAAIAAPVKTFDHHFYSAIAPISEFARRRAQTTGNPVAPQQPGVELKAQLTLPEGDGPFPAILLFPRCNGWPDTATDWPARLSDWGYASLKVFSIASRPAQDDPCNLGRIKTVGNSEMVFDAVGAMKYLAQIETIDSARIAVMGWGTGATGVLKMVNRQGFARLFAERAAAAVAFYPACELHSEFLAPSLVLIGANDRQHPVLFCTEMQRLAAPGSPAFELVIYPDLGHEFDRVDSMPRKIGQDLYQKVRSFLQKYL